MASYNIYEGEFLCQVCKVEVKTLRLYAETKEMTWMCKDKHVSKINLGKRKRSDFDREE
jgi:hypothetical protein